MFWLGNGEQLGGSQPIKDQLDLTVPKKYSFPLILHLSQDFASLGKKPLSGEALRACLKEVGNILI